MGELTTGIDALDELVRNSAVDGLGAVFGGLDRGFPVHGGDGETAGWRCGGGSRAGKDGA